MVEGSVFLVVAALALWLRARHGWPRRCATRRVIRARFPPESDPQQGSCLGRPTSPPGGRAFGCARTSETSAVRVPPSTS